MSEEGILETDWITQTIFKHISRPLKIIHVPKGDRFYNDSVNVVIFKGDIFSTMKQRGMINFGSFHMGDETFNNDINFYSSTWFNFRNYYNGMYMHQYQDSLEYAPLGKKNGLGNQNPITFLKSSERKYLCNFIGSLRANRKYALEQVSYKRDDCFISSGKGWVSASEMNSVDVRHVYLNSKFTICPFGNNEESLRFYESLEFGAIPIAESSKSMFGDFINDGVGSSSEPPPIVRVADWKNVDVMLRYYDERPEELDELQARMIAWWNDRKA